MLRDRKQERVVPGARARRATSPTSASARPGLARRAGPFRDSPARALVPRQDARPHQRPGFGRRDEALAAGSWRRSGRSRSSAQTSASTKRLAFNLHVRSALLRDGGYESLQRPGGVRSGCDRGLKVRVSGGDRDQIALRMTAALGSRRARLRPRGRPDAGGARRRRCALRSRASTSTSRQALRDSHDPRSFLRSLRDGSDYLLPCGRRALARRSGCRGAPAAGGARRHPGRRRRRPAALPEGTGRYPRARERRRLLRCAATAAERRAAGARASSPAASSPAGRPAAAAYRAPARLAGAARRPLSSSGAGSSIHI